MSTLALPNREGVTASLKHRYFLRLHMTFILTATFAAGLVTTRLLVSEICALTYTTSFGSVTIVVWSAVRTIFDAVVPVMTVGGVVEPHRRW